MRVMFLHILCNFRYRFHVFFEELIRALDALDRLLSTQNHEIEILSNGSFEETEGCIRFAIDLTAT